MKLKIKQRLKELFPGVNLSNDRINAIADRLKITEESEIDQALQDADELMDFAAIAKQDDRVRTLEANAKKPNPAPDADPTPDPTPNPNNPNPAPQPQDLSKLIADAVAAAVNPLVQEVTTLKAGKVAETREELLKKALEKANPVLSEIIMDNYSEMSFENDEKFNDFLTKTQTKVAESTQKLTDQGLGQSGRPFTPSGAGSGKEASKEEVDGIFGAL